MTYVPTSVFGPIIVRSNASYSSANFPGFTYDPNLPFTPTNTLVASSLPNELVARSFSGVNSSGNTADYMSQLFIRNDVTSLNYLPLYSCFTPDYYISLNKEIKITFNEAQTGVTLPGGPGSANDRYEVIKFNYSRDVFLKNISGATGTAITGITYSHSIYSGNTYISADQIFYRKLGRMTT